MAMQHLFTPVYYIKVVTSNKADAVTNALMYIRIYGETGVTGNILLDNKTRDDFERGG